MRKRINLFKFGSEQAPPQYLKKLEQYAMGMGLLLFILFLSVNALFLFTRLQVNDYEQQKANLLSKLIDNQDFEAQILYFSKKQNQLTTFLKDDAEFLPYYELLKDLLVFSSNSPVLQTMTLNKDKETEFVVGFESFPQAYDFLKYVESERFLANFLELNLNRLSISEEDNTLGKGYELRFHGKFINLNENKP